MQIPLMQKRQYVHKEDPVEELKEVYSEVKEFEKNFKKALEICGIYILYFNIAAIFSVYD